MPKSAEEVVMPKPAEEVMMPRPAEEVVMPKPALQRTSSTRGLFWGFLGVLAFSATLPMTRLAVAGLDPWFIALGRAVVAGVLAAIALGATGQRWPSRAEWRSLGIVVLGVVIGFPLLSALAMRVSPASHGAVTTGVLPLVTALFAVLRAGERPRPAFWLCSLVGASLVVGYALQRAHGTLAVGDGLMLAAVAVCGLGYAEGGKLARSLGSWQTICWALVMAWPLLLVPTWWTRPHGEVVASAWLGFAYLGVISMFLGFFAWYRGLALGGIARVGQVQLLQPFFTLFLASTLLGEALPPGLMLVAVGVAVTVALGRRLA